MDSQVFTLFHVATSLIAILSGLFVLYGLLTANRMGGTTLLFLTTTAATSVTGFLFHREHVLPAHVVGAIAVTVLLVTLPALYAFHLRGFWRVVYVIGALISLWLNVFVLIVQAIVKIPLLHGLVPQGSEPPFAVVQGIALLLFVALGILAVKRFRPV